MVVVSGKKSIKRILLSAVLIAHSGLTISSEITRVHELEWLFLSTVLHTLFNNNFGNKIVEMPTADEGSFDSMKQLPDDKRINQYPFPCSHEEYVVCPVTTRTPVPVNTPVPPVTAEQVPGNRQSAQSMMHSTFNWLRSAVTSYFGVRGPAEYVLTDADADERQRTFPASASLPDEALLPLIRDLYQRIQTAWLNTPEQFIILGLGINPRYVGRDFNEDLFTDVVARYVRRFLAINRARNHPGYVVTSAGAIITNEEAARQALNAALYRSSYDILPSPSLLISDTQPVLLVSMALQRQQQHLQLFTEYRTNGYSPTEMTGRVFERFIMSQELDINEANYRSQQLLDTSPDNVIRRTLQLQHNHNHSSDSASFTTPPVEFGHPEDEYTIIRRFTASGRSTFQYQIGPRDAVHEVTPWDDLFYQPEDNESFRKSFIKPSAPDKDN